MTKSSEHAQTHDFVADDPYLAGNERRTLLVVLVTSAMMAVEIAAGYLTSSMALLADGWHMASHATALLISLLAYRWARSTGAERHFSFGAGKFIPLGGYTSAIVLGLIALLMFVESARRLMAPVPIEFDEAVIIAAVGLGVNILCAFILSRGGRTHSHSHDHEQGHKHHHHDQNLRSAYIHVLADAVTSVLAIIALLFGKFHSAYWLDPLVGMIGSVVILRWGYTLLRDTAWELLDGHAKSIDRDKLQTMIEGAAKVTVLDLHIWRVAPKALACELVVNTTTRVGSEYYRKLIPSHYNVRHLIVEERIQAEK